jgi:hypothetical protein
MKPSLKDEVIKHLSSLPYEEQRRVLNFVRKLAESGPKGMPGKKLLRFAGVIAPDDVEIMRRVIEIDCEKVDLGSSNS